ncbi:hypothetical protein CMEL01_01209 [Colletotrichum melonis]|uniref:Uncharacterized protein n=1 Tax=Colletotrichum melonis TaxID=1209925 RepID=A0AAI9V2N3_9PEZI|nr:hypothetical protein CMEL01_01209 [Colletotrichum melonis]
MADTSKMDGGNLRVLSTYSATHKLASRLNARPSPASPMAMAMCPYGEWIYGSG